MSSCYFIFHRLDGGGEGGAEQHRKWVPLPTFRDFPGGFTLEPHPAPGRFQDAPAHLFERVAQSWYLYMYEFLFVSIHYALQPAVD